MEEALNIINKEESRNYLNSEAHCNNVKTAVTKTVVKS